MFVRISVRVLFVTLVAFRLHPEPHEERRQHRKNVCLQKCNKQLEEIDAERKEHGGN